MKFQIAFFLIFVNIIKISSRRIESAAEKFDRERYERSRNRPKDKPFDPVANDEEALDFVALANVYGYPAEEHTVETIDGYKLRIHRVYANSSKLETEKKPVVFLQHGLFVSSNVWAFMGPTHDLAYTFADAGFDVWAGNARGNTYSRKHVSLSPNYDREFWHYSFHEMAIYDVTAAIDYILQLTNQQEIIYVGHSMGTTISYILLSERPEYNDKIKLVISLSPSVYWHNGSNELNNILVDNMEIVKSVLDNGNICELVPMIGDMTEIGNVLCKDGSPYQDLCVLFEGFMVGSNPEQLNASLIPHALRYLPGGSSVQTLFHFLQLLKSGRVQKFDYGIIDNFKIYNQKEPPLYNLSNIVAPVAIFYGEGDTVVPKEDVIALSKMLPNVVTLEAVPDKKFSHLDFLLARDLKKLLNDRVVEISLNSLNNP